MKKTIFLAIATVLMAVQLWGQTPPEGTPYIELTVEENSGLKLDFKGNVANTTVWVETSPGNYESKVIGTNWCGYQTYSISGTEVKVYGNIKCFDCGVGSTNADNKVTSVNIEKNLNLTELYCSYNKLTALDVSQNENLNRIYCYNNQFTYLNVANGNNHNFTGFDAANNPDLTCIKVDEGFNPPSDWEKDDIAEWRNDGTDCETSISQLDDAGIQLYPNPASGQISISVPDSYIHNDMVIYNLLGQSLMRIPQNDANQSVDVSSLKSGIYIVKIGQNASKLIIK